MRILGLIAGSLTTGCLVPQVVRSWRTRSTRDLSWVYLLVLAGGILLWLVYGILREDLPLVLANATSLSFVASLIAIKRSADPHGAQRGGR